MADGDRTADAALLIDWENLKFSLKEKEVQPNVSAIRDAAEALGRVVVARAYADWQDVWHHGDPYNLYAAGIEPIYVPTRRYWDGPNTEKRKNSVDVRLTADCIELCHNYDSIGVYVLVTGDQDFLHVVNTLRPYGKSVIIVGVSWSTSARLAERVDNVIYYDREVDPISIPAEAEPASEPAVGERELAIKAAREEATRSWPLEEDLLPELERVLMEIVSLVHDLRSRGQPVLLSSLGMELAKRMSAQNYSMLVKGRLKQLAASLQSARLIHVETQGLVDWLYLPEETPPQAESPEAIHTEHPFATEHFVDLAANERREVIHALRAARSRPSVSFLTFKRICDELSSTSTGRRMGGEMRRFVEGMIEAGVLLQDKEDHQWFDPPTGKTGVFYSYALDAAHHLVKDVDGSG